ncbi:MAG: BatA domain-containing protein, partial [Candidatus Poribacteria bacterium]
MSFLQPLALLALPLMALPIVIHLVNQRRHRTVNWAAMMFLMSAKRMNKGMARLRHLLILLMRMLAVAVLVFAISRPLAGGWLSGVGMGKRDATLVLLDRSASMEALDLQTGESKRSTALNKLVELLEQGGHGTHLVLVDSATGQPREVDSPRALLDLPMTQGTATSADIPGMLEAAVQYLKANNTGRADIWICSDLSRNDWDPDGGRWAALREEFAGLEGAHHFLLSYADQPEGNLSVRVENVRRRTRGGAAELTLDVIVWAAGGDAVPGQVPIEFEVNGVRSVVEVELDARGASLQGHRIPVDARLTSGWGSVGLPADANPLDNRFYFVFTEPVAQAATVVSDDARIAEGFRRAVAIPTDPGRQHRVDVIPLSRVDEVDWEGTGLLIWQGPLPGGVVAEEIERFVGSGRVVVFFPPGGADDGEIFASRWGDWQRPGQEQNKVSWWRGDADLLAHVGSGDALPLNELRTYQYCSLSGPGTALARLGDDHPLLTRVASDSGAVYFCGTLPTAQFSSLERDGVVFYVMLQRALAEGCRSLAPASHRDADAGVLADRGPWEPVAPAEDAPTLSVRGLHAGVYRSGEYWAAVNRNLAEDRSGPSPAATVDDL